MVNSYYPYSYDEALELLDKNNLTIIAGGTDLMVRKRSWSNIAPKFDTDIIFISGIEELDYIDRHNDEVSIGANVCLEDIMNHYDTPELLVEAIKVMASPAIRHSGTLIGNVVNASPAGDSLPVLYLLDATVLLESTSDSRHLPISEFIIGPGKTSIKKDEMIKEVVMIDHHFNYMVYKKVGSRKADTISKICFVGAANVKNGEIKDLRIAVGAVAATIVRDKSIEVSLVGKTVDEIKESRVEIANMYAPLITPIDDQRSSAKYRKETAINLIIDFLKNL